VPATAFRPDPDRRRTYSDADVFRAGMAFETRVGGWYGKPATRPACDPIRVVIFRAFSGFFAEQHRPVMDL
jgi:hypothetical protein